jgi:hypothetical protein
VKGNSFFGSPYPDLPGLANARACAVVRVATGRVNGHSFFGSPAASAAGATAPATTAVVTATRMVVVKVMVVLLV